MTLHSLHAVNDDTVKDFKDSLRSDGVAFVILPAGIAFIFSQYEVGPYAEGDFRVVVPYSKIAGTIGCRWPIGPCCRKAMNTPDLSLLPNARKEFLAYLKFTKGHRDTICYNYGSDLNIWGRWLEEAELDWRQVKPVDLERFVSTLSRNGTGPHAVARKVSGLAPFYKWARRQGLVEEDPVYLIEKPKRPRRIPVWMETEEQQAFYKAMRNHDDIPDNVFGRPRTVLLAIRQRYELLFELIQKTGLRISEALGLKVQDIRLVDGVARSVRVIGKGNKERLVPVPDSFGRVLGIAMAGKPVSEDVFAKTEGGNPMTPRAARDYLKKLVDKAGIEKPITPHKLRFTYATRLLENNAQLIDIQALLGHESIATTQIYTHAGQERLSKLVEGI